MHYFILEVEEENNLVAIIATQEPEITNHDLEKVERALGEHTDEDVHVNDMPVENRRKVWVGTAKKDGAEPGQIEDFKYTLTPVFCY